MAIKISGNTVIDDSQNITNITNVTASGTISGGIIATTAEAQAATADNVIMTPAKVKNLLQGGNASVIKSVQRFTVSTPGGGFRLGDANVIVSSSPDGATLSSPGSTANYTFVNLPTSVNISKSFLTVSVSGVLQSNSFGFGSGVPGEVNVGARLYSSSGNYAGNQVQILTGIPTGVFIYSTSGPVEIYVEVVQFY